MNRRILTVAITTIDGFDGWMAKHSRSAALDRLERNERLLLPILAHYRGQVVKTLGESFLLAFDNATAGVSAAVAIQSAISNEPDSFPLRIAIDTGELQVLGTEEVIRDLYGAPIDVVSRLETVAEPGAVYITDATRQAMDEALHSEPVSEFELPGRAAPLTVYRVDATVEIPALDPSATLSGELSHALLFEHDRASLRRRPQPLAWLLVGTLAAAVALGGYFGVSRYLLTRELRHGRQYLLDGKPAAAFDLAVALRERHADHRVLALMNEALVANVKSLCERDEISQAEEFLQRNTKRYPSLSSSEDAQREIDLARVFAMRGSYVDKYFLTEILQRYPDDVVVRERFMDWFVRVPDRKIEGVVPADTAMMVAQWLLERDASYASAPWFEPAMLKSIANSPRGDDTRSLDFWLTYGGDVLPQFLEEHLYSIDPADADLRWQALLWARKDKPEIVDMMRFNALELLAGYQNVGSQYLRSAAQFFAAQIEAHGLQETRARVDDFVLPPPELLDKRIYDDSLEWQMYFELFADLQRQGLVTLATTNDPIRMSRHNAMRILRLKGWTTPEIVRTYHAGNLTLERWELTHVQEAVAYFAQSDHGDPELAEDLRKILFEVERKGDVSAIRLTEQAIARLGEDKKQ